jgi:hypothetical protein
MFDKIADLCGRKLPVLRRIGMEVAFPAICGVAWGLIAFFNQKKSGFDSVGNGFTAFFFIFFLQGQALRVNKNIRDEDNASEFRDRFDTIG